MTHNRGTTGLFAAPLGKAIAEAAKPAFRKKGFVLTRLLSHWHEIMGKEIACKCYPVEVKFPHKKRNSGILLVRTNGSHALEIQHMEAIIIAKIASYFGYQAICKIRIIQG